MSIETEADLAGLRAVGLVVAETLAAMRARVAPGVTTAELDAAAGRVLRRHGAVSAPREVYGRDDPAASEALTDGLVLTIEPILADGSRRVVAGADGWTIRTADGSLGAHFEHTVVITPTGARILTAA